MKETNIIEGDSGGSEGDALSTNVEFIDNIKTTEVSNVKPTSEANAIMKSAKFPKYHFIEEDDKYFKNEGYCVRDFFVGKYSKKLKSLDNEMFDKLCYESLGITPKEKHPLDNGLDSDSDDEDDYTSRQWKPSDGVSPIMLNYICNKLKITCYAFGITNKCVFENYYIK